MVSSPKSAIPPVSFRIATDLDDIKGFGRDIGSPYRHMGASFNSVFRHSSSNKATNRSASSTGAYLSIWVPVSAQQC